MNQDNVILYEPIIATRCGESTPPEELQFA